MNEDCLKLTVYFGEHERVGRDLSADMLHEVFHRHQIQAAVLLRGIEGFGLRHTLHTHRFLTLSEDLPLISVAVDTREKIEAAVDDVRAAIGKGLVTLERARMLSGKIEPARLPTQLHENTKLTVYCGRSERAVGRPAHLQVVEALRSAGAAGATVLLGVDGMMHGERARARFFSRNAEVPLMIVSVGDGAKMAAALPELGRLLDRPLITLERVRVLKRDGVGLAEPIHLPDTDESGLAIWEKLMVYAGEQARYDGHPLYVQLIRRLRLGGAAGATAVRGTWGFSGDHEPHGDRLLAIARHVPVLTIAIDRPQAMREWWRIIDEVTGSAGLVTSELVPAYHATGGDAQRGGLTLASSGVVA